MLTTRLSMLFALLLAWGAAPARALWSRSESVEWWTSISSSIHVARVDKITPALNTRDGVAVENVELTVLDSLRGEPSSALSIHQSVSATKTGSQQPDAERKLKVGDRVLVFVATERDAKLPGIINWINLTAPDGSIHPRAAYDNEGKHLNTEAKVLERVRARVKQEGNKPPMRRGVIVPMPGHDGDFVWELTRTADPEYKEVLLRQLKQTEFPDEKCAVLYNLASYPGPDVVKLIRSYLSDPTVSEVQRTIDGKTAVERVYPVRTVTYWCLKVMGETPEKPPGFDPLVRSWQFDVGFESTVYFPVGDWVRLKPLDED